ncbi:hypothetical protein FK220_017120 [Flavobacteriaceae bacterium TP-CH-4]|uniref:Uncharacterized protein n=1 Tax=Pelagihabitans pacificus TaxID=2696054 RepID=A0A967B305_9FLAO|nr:hypothetical protein [Pelagihabitans pacificus]NHF61076.1 hypothetical protein [Pelagihabitans pacificus]
MKFPHGNVIYLTMFTIVLCLVLSCTKDSDLLSQYATDDSSGQVDFVNYLKDDNYTASMNESLTMDVLSNDTFSDPERVKIIETSSPLNGEIIIIENKTLLYIPANTSTEQENDQEADSPETESFTYTTEAVNPDETVEIDSATVTVNFSDETVESEVFDKMSKSQLALNAHNALYDITLPPSPNDPLGEPYDGEYGRILRLCEHGNQGDIYHLDALQGVIALFEATGDKKYLNDFIIAVNTLFSKAVPSSALPQTGASYNDSYLSWWGDADTSISGKPVPSVGGQFQLYESRGFMSVARLLYVMHNSPGLLGESIIVDGKTYREHYEYILNFLQVNFWEKWLSRNSLTFQHSGVDSSSAWAYIGWHLWNCTGDSQYKYVYDRFNSDIGIEGTTGGMRELLKPNAANASAYQWNTRFNGEPYQGRKIVDHGHAARVVKFMVEDYTVGEMFYTEEDMSALIRTVDVFWPENFTNYQIRYWLDGQPDSEKDNRNFMPEGWMCLGRFDEALQNRYENMDTGFFVEARTSGVHWAELAYNRAYLEGSVQYPENFKPR